jgi:hypothetical protein
MITLPFSCSEALNSIYLSWFGLLVACIGYGFLIESVIPIALGGMGLFFSGLWYSMWYASEIGDFIHRNIRCKCDA